MSGTFDPNKHLRQLRGKGGTADYLDVKWRLVWLRAEHPDAHIVSDKIEGGIESNFAVFKASVTIPNGGSATGWGSETKADFGDFLEKAETKAIGRALAALGYGTQFAPELDEGERIVDSPREAQSPTPRQTTQQRPSHQATAASPAPTAAYRLTDFWRDTKQAGYDDPKELAAFLRIDTFKDYEPADLLTMFRDQQRKGAAR